MWALVRGVGEGVQTGFKIGERMGPKPRGGRMGGSGRMGRRS